MSEILSENNIVITSKGRFGRIISTDGFKSVVLIGNKQHTILNSELIKRDNLKSLKVQYFLDTIDPFNSPEVDIVFIDKQFVIFDMTKPFEIPFTDEVKKVLSKKLNVNKQIIIVKIELV